MKEQVDTSGRSHSAPPAQMATLKSKLARQVRATVLVAPGAETTATGGVTATGGATAAGGVTVAGEVTSGTPFSSSSSQN